jgi:hypothetical protein
MILPTGPYESITGFYARPDLSIQASGPGPLSDYLKTEKYSLVEFVNNFADGTNIEPELLVYNGDGAPPQPPAYVNNLNIADQIPQESDRDYPDPFSPGSRGAAGEIQLPVATGDSQRVTSQMVADTSPGVATLDGQQMAIWTAEPQSTAPEGTSHIAVTTRQNGTWSNQTYLTAGNRSRFRPAIATDSGKAVAAWRVIDKSVSQITGLDDARNHSTVAYAHYDGQTWSSPTLLPSRGDLYSDVTVASTGNNWAITWGESGENQSLGYAVVNETKNTERTGTIRNATEGELVTANQSAVLAYINESTGTVNRDRLTADARTTLARYTAPNASQLAASANATLWLRSNITRNNQFQYATTGEVETVKVNATIVRNPMLTDTERGTVLVHTTPDVASTSGPLVYRLERNGTWVTNRTVPTVPSTGETELRRFDTTSTPSGFGITFSAQRGNATHLFGTTHEFQPAYSINANPTELIVHPGNTTNITYTLTNTGDVPSSTVPVEFRSDGTTLSTVTHNSLAPGESVTGNATVEIDQSGTVEITVAESVDQLTPEDSRTTLTVAEPAVSVRDVDTLNSTADGANVTVTLTNSGTITATDVPIQIEDTTGPVANLTVDLPAREFVSVETHLNISAVNTSDSGRVVVDPRDTVVGVETTSQPTWLFQPDLTVYNDEFEVNKTSDSVNASVLISNAGTVDANATVAVHTLDGRELGSKTVSVDNGRNWTVFERVKFPLDSWAPIGTEVTVTAIPDTLNEDPGTTAERESFGSLLTGNLGVPPIVGDTLPGDPDDDGLYEDVRGDGDFNILDVQELFNNLGTPVLQDYTEFFVFFDRENPSEVTILDVQELFDELDP